MRCLVPDDSPHKLEIVVGSLLFFMVFTSPSFSVPGSTTTGIRFEYLVFSEFARVSDTRNLSIVRFLVSFALSVCSRVLSP